MIRIEQLVLGWGADIDADGLWTIRGGGLSLLRGSVRARVDVILAYPPVVEGSSIGDVSVLSVVVVDPSGREIAGTNASLLQASEGDELVAARSAKVIPVSFRALSFGVYRVVVRNDDAQLAMVTFGDPRPRRR